jgi:hypothetical protein
MNAGTSSARRRTLGAATKSKARDWQSSIQNRWRLQATSSAVTLLLDSFGSAAKGDYMVAVQTS